MAGEHHSGSVFGAGLVGLLVCGGYWGAWQLAVERYTCNQTGMFACSGPGILLILVGTPLAYILWSLGLRAARVHGAWGAPIAILGGLALVGTVFESMELPTAVVPVAAAALSAAWARLPVLGVDPARE